MRNPRKRATSLTLAMLLVLLSILGPGILAAEEPAEKAEESGTVVIQNPNPPVKTEAEDGDREAPIDFSIFERQAGSCSGSCNCSICTCSGSLGCCLDGCDICFDIACLL